jgi:predicted 3-demethylubiquinone-9 3-methyltransferase (glyoxalase superfamily)
VPKQLLQYLREGDEEQRVRVTVAMMAMKKMDIQGLKDAFDGK